MSSPSKKVCPYRMVRGGHLTVTDRQLVAVTRREPGRMDFTITTQENDDWGRPSPRVSRYEIELDE